MLDGVFFEKGFSINNKIITYRYLDKSIMSIAQKDSILLYISNKNCFEIYLKLDRTKIITKYLNRVQPELDFLLER